MQPGDRLVIVTDGMLERNAAFYDISVEINNTMSLHPREVTRQLADNVLADSGPFLADDATILVLDWHGHEHRRAELGTPLRAQTNRASSPW